MINITDIQAKAVGLVGWRQSTRSGSPIISEALKATRSGLYFQDASGLVTVDNIKATVEDDAITDQNLNNYLEIITKSAFIELLNSVGFNESDIIDNRLLYKYPGDWKTTIENQTHFVGYELDLTASKDYSVIINQVMTEFNAADSITLLLFNANNKAAIQTKTITTAEDTATITDLGWSLSSKYKSNLWYIGYITGSLSAEAYNRKYQKSNIRSNYSGCAIRPIKVLHNTNTLFDINDVEYTSESYGLNFDITTTRDYTDLVLRNENNFAVGLQMQVAIKVLDIISNSIQTNRSERLSKANALFELNGNRINPEYPEHTGILSKLKKEVSRLRRTYLSMPQLTRMTL